jgi:predicted ATPase
VLRVEELIGGDALPWTDPHAFAERCIARAAYFFNTAGPARATSSSTVRS